MGSLGKENLYKNYRLNLLAIDKSLKICYTITIVLV